MLLADSADLERVLMLMMIHLDRLVLLALWILVLLVLLVLMMTFNVMLMIFSALFKGWVQIGLYDDPVARNDRIDASHHP